MTIISFLKVSFLGLLALSQLQAQTIDFAALKTTGGEKSSSSFVMLDQQGTIATVVELGSDVNQATLVVGEKKVPLAFVTNDSDSRVAIYKLPVQVWDEVGQVAELGSSTGLTPSMDVYSSATERNETARVVGKIHRFQGKVLPLAVLRLNHKKAAPQPGSGVYDRKGKLIGLVRQAVFDDSKSSYCLPIEVVQRILMDKKRNEHVSRCWIGIIMDELVAAPIIESVRPDSPAKKAGLQNGDVILSIGGAEVREYAEVVDAFYYLIAGEQKKFKVLRGTEIKEFIITPEVSPGR